MSDKAKKTVGIPTCADGGKETDITLNEGRNGSLACGSCGTRFPVQGDKVIGMRYVMKIPEHKIPTDLHELRKRMEREERESRARGTIRAEHLTGEANLTTRP